MAIRPSSTQSSHVQTARTSLVPQTTPSTTHPAHAPNLNNAMSPELEQTLSLMSAHRSVLGYMLINRGHHPSIIRHSGVVFDGEQGRRYAAVIARIVENVQSGLEEVRGDDGLGPVVGDTDDEVRFMRIRTRRHEIMISPDDRYLLCVLHDPAAT